MRIYKIIFFVLLFTFSSCLEDSFIEPLDLRDDSEAALLLTQIDITGSFRQNHGTPVLVNAYSVYSKSGDYDLIDLRSNNEYVNGHISGAVHVETENILDYLQDLEENSNKRKLLISRNGFWASYVNCLVNIAGITNVCVLKYGVSGWNNDLSRDWSDNLNTYTSGHYKLLSYYYPAMEHTKLPEIIGLPGNNTVEKLSYRVKEMFSSQDQNLQTLSNPASLFFRFDSLYNYFNRSNDTFNGIFILCYDDMDIYNIYGTTNVLLPAHPPETRRIEPPLKFNPVSDDYIQTIASDKTVAIYCADGHNSAYVTAFLRLLGYNAKAMLYGTNTFAWNGMTTSNDEETRNRAFRPENVLNLPYVTGENP